MQIRKEIFLFLALIVLSAGLLLAANISSKTYECPQLQRKKVNCCQEIMKSKTESPWNYITSGILHLSV